MDGTYHESTDTIYWLKVEKEVPVKDLDYHENWNSMAEVCKRIFGDGCPNEEMYKIENRIQEGLSRLNMELVYTAVSDYIEEWNKLPN